MKIIALYGRSECGKSETLGIHLRALAREKAGVVNKETIWKDTRECITFGDKIIDICPPGDTEAIVLENITFFKSHPFDVAYTATRSWGKGCRALDKYASEIGAELSWIKKPYNDDLDKKGQSEENKALGEKLFKLWAVNDKL